VPSGDATVLRATNANHPRLLQPEQPSLSHLLASSNGARLSKKRPLICSRDGTRFYEIVRNSVGKKLRSSSTVFDQDHEIEFMEAMERAYFFFGDDVKKYLEQCGRTSSMHARRTRSCRRTMNRRLAGKYWKSAALRWSA